MKMLAATRPTNPAAIHSIVLMKRSMDVRFISAPTGFLDCEASARRRKAAVQGNYCVKALYLVSDARSSLNAVSGSPPAFLTLSPQVLISGSDAFFHSAGFSPVSRYL